MNQVGMHEYEWGMAEWGLGTRAVTLDASVS
jgi:hypothetical protein